MFLQFTLQVLCAEGLAQPEVVVFYFILFSGAFVGPNPDGEVVRLDLRLGGGMHPKYVDEEQQCRPS